jgi:nucleoside recognition membrane protein YjiH
VNGIYRWTFEVPVSLGGLFTQSQYLTQDASIKARYVSASGDKVGSLVSEDLRLTPATLTAVPEPVSAVLLLTVIAGVALTFRKSLRS